MTQHDPPLAPRSAARELQCFDDKPVLVTGGAGFFGSALCSELKRAGAVVHSVSRREHGPVAAERHWRVDLAEETAVRELIRDLQPAYVFHLASHVMGAPDIKHLMPSFRGNLQTSVNLACALVETPCTRMVTTGSLVEPDPGVAQKIPNSPYAAAKWASSDYARMFHALYGLPIAIARVFMVYGPGQQDETKLVPYVIRCLLRGERPKITSGTHTIDWVFLNDVVGGLLKLAAATNADGQTVDIGSGSVVTTATVVDTLCELMGGLVQPEYGALPERPLEPHRVASVRDSERLIGWRPRVSLREGLQLTIDSYRAQVGEVTPRWKPSTRSKHDADCNHRDRDGWLWCRARARGGRSTVRVLRSQFLLRRAHAFDSLPERFCVRRGRAHLVHEARARPQHSGGKCRW